MPDFINDNDADHNGYPEIGASNPALDLIKDEDISVTTGESMPTKDALLYEHPDSIANCLKWEKYLDCYNSKDMYRYLKKHLRENTVMFEQRLARGYFFNYTASIVDLFVAYVYHAPVTRNLPENDFIKQVLDNCDLKGSKYTTFIQKAATLAQIFGHSLVMVDAPQAPEGGYANEAQRQEAQHRPFLTLVRADQVKDWELDEHGNFEWVKIEIFPPQNRSWDQKVDEEVRTFLIWNKQEWKKYQVKNDEVTPLGNGKHPLGAVPLVRVYNEPDLDHSWFGISAVRDIADINLAIYNWSSMGDEEIFERCLNIIAMEKDGSNTPVEISQHNVLEYESGTNAPTYLTPGETPLKVIREWIENGKNEIYRIAKMGGATGVKNQKESTSGIAYAFEFNETNQTLGKKAESLEQAESEIFKLIFKWINEVNPEFSIIYPKEFGVDDFLMELQILMQARVNFTSETGVKELEKKILAKLFAKDSSELRAKIAKEVDAANLKPATFDSMETILPPDLISGAGLDGAQLPPRSTPKNVDTATSAVNEGK
jgi:hypothetical protein